MLDWRSAHDQFRSVSLVPYIELPLTHKKDCDKIREKEKVGKQMGKYAEYTRINSGDKEIDNRVVKTLEQLSNDPSASIQRACGDKNQSKAVYRLLSNKKFESEQVTRESAEESNKRIDTSGCETVLIVQDTSTVDYSHLRASEEMGVIGINEKSRGLLLHSAIGIGTNNEIYGLMGQEIIIREAESYGKKHQRKKKPIEDKESYKWIKMMEETQKNIPSVVTGVHISDREGDIYEYFERCENIGSNYLCRRTYNRNINGGGGLNEYIDGLSEKGELSVHIPRDSHTKRLEREAKLSVKFGKTEILRSKNLKMTNEHDLEKLTVYVISAVEKDTPSNVKEPISWQLITNIPVENFSDAVEKIDWYTKRWRIEDFHYTLKSGCSIEKRQASSREKVKKLIALYSVIVIAIDILIMTWLARAEPDVSCEVLFAEDEWKILYCVANKTKKVSKTAPTVYEAVRFVAMLGGFPARKSDGEPGVKSIWIGLSKLRTILFAKNFC
jgi:hypothetical protein